MWWWALIERHSILESDIIYFSVLLKNNIVIKKNVHENARQAARAMSRQYYTQCDDSILWIHLWQNERKWSVHNCGSFGSGNAEFIWAWLIIIEVLAPFTCKPIMTPTLLYSRHERQLRLNNFHSWVLSNHTAYRSQSIRIDFLAAFIGQTDSNALPAPWWKWPSTERQWFLVMHSG